ncbi:DUF3817 domain-containing protein [Kineococcus sp. NUM-3379]
MPHRQVAVLFRAVAVAEAVSWAALLVTMYLKYVVEAAHEGGVPVSGAVHGGLFVAYLVVTLLAARTFRWSAGATLLALLAAVPPFGTIVFERLASRRGMLAGAEPARA